MKPDQGDLASALGCVSGAPASKSGSLPSIALQYKFVEGFHIFFAMDMPGFYVASRDMEKAVANILPSLCTLIKLDAAAQDVSEAGGTK
jgi:hypothetical protein